MNEAAIYNTLKACIQEATAGSHGLGSAEIIEKRAAMAALLVSTCAFNPELVLLAADVSHIALDPPYCCEPYSARSIYCCES